MTKIPQSHILKNFSGEVLSNTNLSGIVSEKQIRHIEISIPENITYEPGDAVAIVLDDGELGIGKTIEPRLYSISSSRNAHGNRIHITVSVVHYVDEKGKVKDGLASNYLGKIKAGDRLHLYISSNPQFKLPADDRDIIMVGPGTGVAPFRAFLAERNYRKAPGRNWLFFGEQHFQTEFLYRDEWKKYLESGLLNRMDVAFSRDQEKKIYVQNRMLENSDELFRWLENGAFFYVCGDKKNMAADVEKALLEIIAKHQNGNSETAQEYLPNLINKGRYLRDVY